MFVVFSPDVTPYFIIYRAHAPVLGLPYPPKPHVWCPEKTAVCLRHFPCLVGILLFNLAAKVTLLTHISKK